MDDAEKVREAHRERARQTIQMVETLLRENRCRIVTRILYEPVGDGSRILLSSNWAVEPIVEE